MAFSIHFTHSWILFFLVVPAALGVWIFLRRPTPSSGLRFPGMAVLSGLTRSGLPARATVTALRVSALCILVLIAAGPILDRPTARPAERATWILLLDVSSSMTADDFEPSSRLESAKRHLEGFVRANSATEFGLIVFAGSARLLIPRTFDHEALLRALRDVAPAGFGEDGTAIGAGIGSAVNRLRDVAEGARGILLITDGVSNRGAISPKDAARLGETFGAQIHALGLGTDAVSQYWVPTAAGPPRMLQAKIEIDDQELMSLAEESGGSYRRVRTSQELGEALAALPAKAAPGEPSREEEASPLLLAFLVWPALFLLLAEFLAAEAWHPVLPGGR